jgi:16S rRNA (adenine1518-N6/adenine1519-N6)-dimethyltransferase
VARRPRLGQHFLTDARILDRIVGHAALRGDETVLEIGPGRGDLTRRLAAQAAHVVAIEKDAELVDDLHDEGLPDNVEVVLGDALKVPFPAFDKCVSNLPYGISSDVTFRLLEHRFDLAILMFQREFAKRLAAPPGSDDYGRLSVNCAVKARAETLDTVPPGAFAPPPRVSSVVVRLTPLEQPPFPIGDQAQFEDVVRAAFQHRRKTLRNALLDQWPAFASSREALVAAAPALPHVERRAESLAPREFEEVAEGLRRAALPRPGQGD